MAKYIYPAVFTPEANGQFAIHFPDIENCFTCGDDLGDGISMAEDVLSLMLTHLEDKGSEIPAADLHRKEPRGQLRVSHPVSASDKM